MPKHWRWQFVAFKSEAEGVPAQAWFDALSDDDRYEILDLLNTLSVATRKLWRRPEFDPLEGAGGISEIRIPDIRSETGVVTYRIYGFFGPGKHQYCFLHGTGKNVKNDEEGKAIAKYRLDQIGNGSASVCQFAFEEDTVGPTETGNRSEN